MASVLVVHAEGAGELGERPSRLSPRDPLLEDDRGPIHAVIASVAVAAGVPAAALDFREPLRKSTGGRPKGSDLLDDQVLDELLAAWQLADPTPAVVVIVDADEDAPRDRAAILRDALERNELDGAVGVSVKEFEAWLIADDAALRRVFGPRHSVPEDPESLPPGEAKRRLQAWVDAASRPGRGQHELRRELAAALDVDTVAARCPSFADFRAEVEAVLTR